MSNPTFRFGTVGAPTSTPKKPGGSVGGVLRLAELELCAFELGWVQSVRVSETTCEQIRSTAQAQDVAISVHAPYFINLNANDDEWPKSRKRLMDSAHYGNLAGATDIIFHPGSYFEREPAEVLKVAIPRLQGCIEELRAEGNPVTLRPETMGKSAMLGSLEDTLAMSREVEGVEPCLDFAHLFARTGNGGMNSYDEWRAALEGYAKELGGEALSRLHIHLSGIAYGPKGEKEHLKLEDSEMRFQELLRALRDMGCGGRILCESPVLEEDALLMKNFWDKLL